MAKISKKRKIQAVEKRTDGLGGERLRTAPFQIRLTEKDDVVRVPEQVQLFKTGNFKKIEPNGKTVQFEITRQILAEILKNFNAKVRGVDLAIDFGHNSDEEAAGWIKDLILKEGANETQLWAEVDWTPDGYQAVAGKKYRYLSPDFAFSYQDNETGKKFGATLFGAGLTNRPVIKNMAPAVELTEVEEMATKIIKKISEMSEKELRLRLAEEEKADEVDQDTIDFITLRLEEMSDDSDEDDKPAPKKKGKKGDKEMNFEELQAAYDKMCGEMADMKKSMAASLAETQNKAKEASFALLCAEGKAVPAQKESFLAGDMQKFAELAAKPKFETIGGHGASEEKVETPVQDEVLQLAEKAFTDKKVAKRTDAVSWVLKQNPELNKKYEKEMSGETA